MKKQETKKLLQEANKRLDNPKKVPPGNYKAEIIDVCTDVLSKEKNSMTTITYQILTGKHKDKKVTDYFVLDLEATSKDTYVKTLSRLVAIAKRFYWHEKIEIEFESWLKQNLIGQQIKLQITEKNNDLWNFISPRK